VRNRRRAENRVPVQREMFKNANRMCLVGGNLLILLARHSPPSPE
jgi:hypothetical protein